jgi:plastocyanin
MGYYYPPPQMSYRMPGYSMQMPQAAYGSLQSGYGSPQGAYGSPSTAYAGQDSSSSGYASTSTAPTVSVGAYDNYFREQRITIAAGTTVQWTNHGQHTHTITSDTALWDPVKLAPGDVYGRKFAIPGTFEYHCAIHPADMRGIIVVK